MPRRTSLVIALATVAIGALGAQPGAPGGGGPPTPGLPLKATRTHTFTTTKGTWISLDVSPDGQTIVFDLLGDLYTLPITGGTAKRITSGLAFDAQPRFSPDGSRIVFISDRSGGENVWTAKADGTDTTQVTTGNVNMYVSPVYAPDGKSIIVSRSGGTFGTAKLWMYYVDGGRGVQLSTTPPVAPTLKMLGATFGADPRFIWFAARTGDWQYNALGPQYQIYTWDRENGRVAQMTRRQNSAFRPALSKDGRYLAYAARFETKTGLRLRNLETQQEDWLAFPVQRDEIESRAPMDAYPGYAFTPDSKAIIISYGGEIWRVPVDKSAPSKIPLQAEVQLAMGPEVKFTYRVDTSATFTAKQVRDLAPSPDRTQLAFSALDRLYVMDWPAGTPRRVSTANVGEFGPVWSPDGTSLAYVTWSDAAGGSLMRATRDRRGAWSTRVLSPTGLFSDLAWSPAGDRIVAVRAAARELQEAGAAFFGPAASEFVWISANGGPVTTILPTGGLGLPHFTKSADRIYAYGREGLQSFRWDGTDLKTHLKVTGPLPPGAGGQMTLDAALDVRSAAAWIGGRAMRPDMTAVAHASHLHPDESEPTPPQPPPASMVLVSPSGDRALAMVGMDFYTIAMPVTGATPPTVSVADPASAPVPVKKLNEIGGEFPTWASDSLVMWSLGNAVWTYDLARGKAVDDSLAADARRRVELRRVPASRDSLNRLDSLARADTVGGKKPVKPGYKPVEQRVAVSATRDTPRGSVVLRGAKAITMKGYEIIENADVVVVDNRITAVGARGSVPIPAGAKEIDVSGKIIMP
ncbi:MAG: amidohydrolase, partial [Gemmatimonadaceae bacterium]|nr:amidohydrolase [Gemmatimonadaceae bacterium]